MLPFKKVLFPVDYSEPCKAVIPYVLDIISHFKADLTLVHVYGPESLAYVDLPLADPSLPELARTFEVRQLTEFAQTTFPEFKVETVVELGEPGTAIHKLIEKNGTDLVMLPTHGRGPLRRFLLGSVAAKVLHDVSPVVWTGTGSMLAGHKPSLPYKSIVCALDDGEERIAVLKAAKAFADSYQAKLSLVHVVELPPPTMEVDWGQIRKDVIDGADTGLRELKNSLGIDAPHRILESSVAGAVHDAAVQAKADLIVAGRGHAQSGLGRVWSSLYSIVREAPCPVLSI